MTELDTIADLLRYMRWKEDLVASDQLRTAASESDLLGYYMYNRENVATGALAPPAGQQLSIDPGEWEQWADSARRSARQRANKVSYLCDDLINSLTELVLAGATLDKIDNPYGTAEQSLRRLALEPRLVRRSIAAAWLEVMRDPSFRDGGFRLLAGFTGDTVYGLLLLPKPPHMSEQEYREYRANLLYLNCVVAMSQHKPPVHVIGIATEPRNFNFGFVDAIYCDPSKWNDEAQKGAVEIQKKLGLLTNVQWQARVVADSPESPVHNVLKKKLSKTSLRMPSLNGPCSCGSGKTFKTCHGKHLKRR